MSRPTRARGLKRRGRHVEGRDTWSRPKRARGLKQTLSQHVERLQSASRPTRARGLKLNDDARHGLCCTSRPTRARGLKLIYVSGTQSGDMSRPTRARGLKPRFLAQMRWQSRVAPHAGAWIETSMRECIVEIAVGRAPRGRVD